MSKNIRTSSFIFLILSHVFVVVGTHWKYQPMVINRCLLKTLIFSHWKRIPAWWWVHFLLTIYYLKTWWIWALNLPPRISACLSLKWMAFCQFGLAPSAAVSTLKSEGQRGDVSIDTLLEITLSPPEILSRRSSTMAGRWLWILGRELRDAIKKANVINF